MKDLAPVSISTYNRVEHLEKTIEALKKNYLAEQTTVYIFSDAPKSGDEKAIAKVRDYLDTVDGFKEVIVVKQPTNSYAKNMLDAHQIPLKKFGKIIRMEDDIVTSKYFLTYMNNALDFYENDKRIFAINAYTPDVDLTPIIEGDLFLSKDFNAWGNATWLRKREAMDNGKIDYYDDIIKDKNKVNFINSLHPMMIDVLHLMKQGKTNPGDFRISAYLHLNNLFTVKPKKSLTQNIGFDGSGVGGAVVNKFDTSIDDNYNPKMSENLEYNYNIDKIIFDKYFNERFSKKFMIKLKHKLKIHTNEKFYNGMKKLLRKFI
jgi:hypothetical protein